MLLCFLLFSSSPFRCNPLQVILDNTFFYFFIFIFFSFIYSPQGIAFRNIPLDKKLYAMVCSTSAKSSVRLINTTSFRDCLQFRCMKVITKYPQLLDVSIRIDIIPVCIHKLNYIIIQNVHTFSIEHFKRIIKFE